MARGKVVEVWRESVGDFPRGTVALRRLDADDAYVRLEMQGEYLVALADGEPLVTTPDLLCCLDVESGQTGVDRAPHVRRGGGRGSAPIDAAVGASGDARPRRPAGVRLRPRLRGVRPGPGLVIDDADSLTVRDLLEIGVIGDASLLAGERGLDLEVTDVRLAADMTAVEACSAGDLVILTGNQPYLVEVALRRAYSADVRAVVLVRSSTGTYQPPSAATLSFANRLGVPLLQTRAEDPLLVADSLRTAVRRPEVAAARLLNAVTARLGRSKPDPRSVITILSGELHVTCAVISADGTAIEGVSPPGLPPDLLVGSVAATVELAEGVAVAVPVETDRTGHVHLWLVSHARGATSAGPRPSCRSARSPRGRSATGSPPNASKPNAAPVPAARCWPSCSPPATTCRRSSCSRPCSPAGASTAGTPVSTRCRTRRRRAMFDTSHTEGLRVDALPPRPARPPGRGRRGLVVLDHQRRRAAAVAAPRADREDHPGTGHAARSSPASAVRTPAPPGWAARWPRHARPPR